MTMDDGAVTRAQVEEATGALESLVAALDENGQLELLIQQVCQHAVRVVPGADMASVTLLHSGQPETAACTNDQVFYLDRDQYQAGDGPCLQAASTGKLVRVTVDEAAARWPEFTRSARQAGVSSYLSAPLVVDEQHAGALNLYGLDGHGYRDVDASLVELYLTAVVSAVRSASRYWTARQLSENLQEALVSRAVIDQAKGIVMGAHGIPAEQAFKLLVQVSQDGNVKVRDVASRLVTSVANGKPMQL